MNKLFCLITAILLTSLSFGQKKEKVKGSKMVTIEKHTLEEFENLDVEDNLQIYLVKGLIPGIEIETDDNLQEYIKFDLSGKTLRLYTSKDITTFKKLAIRVNYTEDFKLVQAKNEVTINALEDVRLNSFTVKNIDYSKSFLNVKSDNFTLIANDKSKIELNLKSEKASIELSKNVQIKALVTSTDLKMDMYQKTTASIEGDVKQMKLRLDNNANYTGKNLVVNHLQLVAEQYVQCNVNATKSIEIQASGKAEIQLYGAGKIDMKSFSNNAILYKKEKK